MPIRRFLPLALVIVIAAGLAGCDRHSRGSSQGSSQGQGAQAPSVETSKRPTRFTVLGAGDVLLHDPLVDTAASDAKAAGRDGYDFGPMFATVQPVVSSADLAICHMETPLGEPNGPFSGFPVFNAPPQVATTLAKIGYDSCSTASNHTLDQGEKGVYRTLDVLDAAGVKHAGSYRSQAAHDEPTILKVHGIAVAHLSYTFSFNGIQRPAGKDWIANYLEADAVLAEARQAKKLGAEVVIVSLHFGTEYQHLADANQQQLAKILLSSPDVDLILGAHVHVVQPFQRIGDKWVAYGMGNQVSNQYFSLDTRDGVMPRFTFEESSPGHWTVTKAEALPTWMHLTGGPHRLKYCPDTPSDPDCHASTQRTAATVRSMAAQVDVAGA